MVLALCMVCSAAALGEETVITTNGQEAVTTVTFEIKPKMDFTVTIPAEINVSPTASSAVTTLTIDAPNFEAEGWGVNVSLIAASGMTAETHPGVADFFMRDRNDNTISYNLYRGQKNRFRLGDQIVGWTCAPGGSSHAETSMHLYAGLSNNQAIGTYTDTLTFLVSLVEPPIQ